MTLLPKECRTKLYQHEELPVMLSYVFYFSKIFVNKTLYGCLMPYVRRQ